jgi:hypothetical protein
MSDTTRQIAPDERVSHLAKDLSNYNPNLASLAFNTDPIVANVTMTQDTLNTPPHALHDITREHPDMPLLPRMVEALEEGPTTLQQILTLLPNDWQEVNPKGTLITKHILSQCVWGEHTEADGLQTLQQAILTAYPPTQTNVT